MIEAGQTNPKTIAAKIRKIITAAKSFSSIDYISIVDAETLQEVSRLAGRVLIAIAARFGSTRLIDNLTVDCRTR